MNVTEAKKRKLIDLDKDTFRILSINAAAKGTNLKALIENSLKEMAEDLKDAELYAHLVETRPEGKIMLQGQEKASFEKWLGI